MSRQLIDLTNQRYSTFTVLRRDKNHGHHTYWICQCDCGNIKSINSELLRLNKPIYCKECKVNANLIDLTGQTFGKLKVLRIATQQEKKDKKTKDACWICQCECGNIKILTSSNLKSGKTKSCGCQRFSNGEQIIKDILLSNNIKFVTEKVFKNCIFPDTQAYARFDFFINNQYIIEYDGKQHFTNKFSGWNTKEQSIKTKIHDQIKNEFCFNNNIPIIRIPYTHYNNICLNDLLLETSQFILKE